MGRSRARVRRGGDDRVARAACRLRGRARASRAPAGGDLRRDLRVCRGARQGAQPDARGRTELRGRRESSLLRLLLTACSTPRAECYIRRLHAWLQQKKGKKKKKRIIK